MIESAKFRLQYRKELHFMDEVHVQRNTMRTLSNVQLQEKIVSIRRLLRGGSTMDHMLPEIAAVVAEAAFRNSNVLIPLEELDQYPYGFELTDAQLIGAFIALQSDNPSFPEIGTGVGKTVVTAFIAIARSFVNEDGVHIATSVDSLAKDGATNMAPIYAALGIPVGYFLDGDNGLPRAYMVTADRQAVEVNPHSLYRIAPVVYGSITRFGFDYMERQSAGGISASSDIRVAHAALVVDELDDTMIDKALLPLVRAKEIGQDVTRLKRIAAAIKEMTARRRS